MNRLIFPAIVLSFAAVIAVCLVAGWTPQNSWIPFILGCLWAGFWIPVAIRAGKRQGGQG